MPTATIIYSEALHTEATHLRSGTPLATDAPLDNNGKGESFSPTDLVATGLATCMLTLMGIAAEKRDLHFKDAQAEMTKEMASDPRRISRIAITITMPRYPYSEKEKAVLEYAARNCPVAKSLHPDIEQDVTFIYPEV